METPRDTCKQALEVCSKSQIIEFILDLIEQDYPKEKMEKIAKGLKEMNFV